MSMKEEISLCLAQKACRFDPTYWPSRLLKAHQRHWQSSALPLRSSSKTMWGILFPCQKEQASSLGTEMASLQHGLGRLALTRSAWGGISMGGRIPWVPSHNITN